MNSNFRTFTSNIFGDLTVFIDTAGESWFKARDISDALGLARTVIRRIEDDDKRVEITDVKGGYQETIFVNEAGLYQLVLSCRKPAAKAFKHWVTHDVLPSIRRTGGYIFGQELLSAEDRKVLEGRVQELSTAVAKANTAAEKANAGKAKLQSYLAEAEDRCSFSFDLYREESKKRREAEDTLRFIAQRFSDIENVERFMAALKCCREFDARHDEFVAVDREEEARQRRIPYAKVRRADPDPLVRDSYGNVCRRSEMLGTDRK